MRRLTALITLVALVALAGCGGDDGDEAGGSGDAGAGCAKAGRTVAKAPRKPRKKYLEQVHNLQRYCPGDAKKQGLANENLPTCKRLDQEGCTYYPKKQ